MAKQTKDLSLAEKVKKQTKTTTKKTVKKQTGEIPKIKVSVKKKIVFLGSEAAPFIATGGLADVLGSLPKALAIPLPKALPKLPLPTKLP